MIGKVVKCRINGVTKWRVDLVEDRDQLSQFRDRGRSYYLTRYDAIDAALKTGMTVHAFGYQLRGKWKVTKLGSENLPENPPYYDFGQDARDDYGYYFEQYVSTQYKY